MQLKIGVSRNVHYEIKEVLGMIGLEGYDELLVVQAERVRRVQLHRREAVTDLDVYVHHLLSLLERKHVPRARLHERVHEEVLRASGLHL
jgi:hypothetical protein